MEIYAENYCKIFLHWLLGQVLEYFMPHGADIEPGCPYDFKTLEFINIMSVDFYTIE
jgi:hypothetical protein